jgi:hypothetical protein
MWEAYAGRLWPQVCLRKNKRPDLKITKAEKAGGVAQMVELLPSKHEALSLKPQY